MAAKGFIQKYQKAVRAVHPHLGPINRATFASDRDLALGKVVSLAGYEGFLAAARSTKMKRKGATLAFERNVQTQGRQALGDMHEFGGAVLRLTQQVNQTNLWPSMLTRMAATLKASGPVKVKELWNEVWQNQRDPEYRAALKNHGLTDEIAAAVTEGLAKADATLSLKAGSVAIEGKVPGSRQPSRVLLKAPGSRPTNVLDLLGSSQFDQVVSAFTHSDPVYLEVVPATSDRVSEPAHLFAVGTIMARQRAADHSRKLDDTGLATYEGNDPGTLIVLLVAGLAIGLIGVTILMACDESEDGGPPLLAPDWYCAVGELLVYIAMLVLELVALAGGGGVVASIAYLAFGALLPELVANYNFLVPGFTANPATPPP